MLACLAEIVHCTIYTGAQNTPTSDGDDIVLFVVFTFHHVRNSRILVSTLVSLEKQSPRNGTYEVSQSLLYNFFFLVIVWFIPSITIRTARTTKNLT